MKTSNYIEMDYLEIEDLVEKTYGVSYSLVADLEESNDSAVTYNNMTKREMNDFDRDEIERFKENPGKAFWIFPRLLQDMVNNGVLPEGNYMIQISW